MGAEQRLEASFFCHTHLSANLVSLPPQRSPGQPTVGRKIGRDNKRRAFTAHFGAIWRRSRWLNSGNTAPTPSKWQVQASAWLTHGCLCSFFGLGVNSARAV